MSTTPTRESDVGSRPEWWRGAAIYHIYPRSFADSNGDGIGDLPGITAHLEHVASLGVDALWLSPFFTSPMKDFGYDVADYCNVDALFGTLQDFARGRNRSQAHVGRVDACNSRGDDARPGTQTQLLGETEGRQHQRSCPIVDAR